MFLQQTPTPSPFVGKPNYTFVQTNVFDKGKITPMLESGRVSALIHLACSVDNDFPSEINEKEMGDSRAADKYIYKSAASSGVKDIIILSTTQIYAPQKTREPIRETADEKPTTNYAKMKSESEMALASAVKELFQHKRPFLCVLRRFIQKNIIRIFTTEFMIIRTGLLIFTAKGFTAFQCAVFIT